MNSKFVLRAVVLTLAASILVFLLVGQVLADSFEIRSERTVRATPDKVAALMKDLDTWPAWSAFRFECGNPTERRVEGDKGTVGHRSIWSGPRAQAVVELTAVAPASIAFRIRHAADQNGAKAGGELTGEIEWRATDDGCHIVWTERGKLDGVMQRWINWFGAHQEMVKRVQGSSLSGLEEYLRKNG